MRQTRDRPLSVQGGGAMPRVGDQIIALFGRNNETSAK
jgi:hypothetical protein